MRLAKPLYEPLVQRQFLPISLASAGPVISDNSNAPPCGNSDSATPASRPSTRLTRSNTPAISCATTAELVVTPSTIPTRNNSVYQRSDALVNIRAAAGNDDDFAAALLRLDDAPDGGLDPLQGNRRKALFELLSSLPIGWQ